MSADELGEQDWRTVAQLAELGVLSASLVHELRQPLFAIRAIGELLSAEVPEPLRQRLGDLLEQARYAERLVQHYGVMDAPERGRVLLDLNDPVRAAVQMLRHRAERRGVSLQVELAARPVLVFSRPSAVQQMAVNLLGNALDAVEGRSECWVRVYTIRGDHRAELVIEDSGAGLSPAVRERVFEPFVTSKAPGRGTGLGLAITRTLAREDDGDVQLEEAAGGGLRAVVHWPLATRTGA